MAKKFPLDEFDAASVHGGRHRARRTGKDRALEWVKIFGAGILVAGAAWGVLKVADASSVFEGVISNASPSPTATEDARPGVAVVDGSGKTDDAKIAAGQLFAADLETAGFNVLNWSALEDADGKPITIETSTIVITDELFRAEAEEMAKLLGSPLVTVSDQFAGPITIVLGTEYEIPVTE